MKTTLVKSILFSIASIIFFCGCKKDKATTNEVKSHTYSATSWEYISPYYITNFAVDELTSDNIDESAVMVYFSKNGGTDIWHALPYTQYDTPDNYYMGFKTSAGNVEVNWFYDSSLSKGDNPNTFYGNTVQFKVVIIPVSTTRMHPDLDLKNYETVKEKFKLKN